MADDGADYIFENKRETSREFVLANGDVASVLNGLRSGHAMQTSFGRRGSSLPLPDSTVTNHAGIEIGGLSLSRRSGGTGVFSVNAPTNVLSVPVASRQTGESRTFSSGMMSLFSGPGRGNTSNGEDLTLKEQETPVFDGLFANRSSESFTIKRDSTVARAAAGFSPLDDISNKALLSAGNDIPVPGELRDGSSDAGAAPSWSAARRTVKHSLTISAEDMAGFKSYQVGGGNGNQEVSGSGSPVYHAGAVSNAYLSSSGGYEYGFSEPAVGRIGIPERPIGGWITIPERPIGGWITIPERPIGGWIIDPVPFREYDIFEAYGVELSSDWTEYTDSDFSKIDLEYGSKLSLSVKATNAATFTIYRCVQNENGGYSLEALQTTALTYDRESGDYVATTQAILLEAGQYCLYVQASDPAREGDPAASYRFELNREDSDMFVDGDNSDDWTDLRTEGEFGEVAYAGVLDEYSFSILSDWVGFGDEVDYAGFTLNSAAKLSFSLNATDAAKFTIYQLVQDRNGKYSLKTLQTTTLAYDKDFEEYEANTKALLLEAGEYYFSMQSTNAAQGGSACYDVDLNAEDGAVKFFAGGDNSDDWTDLKTEGASGQVADVGVIDGNSYDICTNWVGFGDEFDYAKFTLDSSAELSFSLYATDAVKFTVYRLVQGRNGTYSLKKLQTTKLTYDKEFEEYAANTKALLLEAGEYYFSMQSTNAAQGGSADYNVSVDSENSVFYSAADSSGAWDDLEIFGPDAAVYELGTVDESTTELTCGQTFGKEADYAHITLYNAAKLSFLLNADNAAKFTVCRMVRDKSGKYVLNALQTTSLSFNKQTQEYDAATKALLLEAGDYYISMQSASADGANYTISVTSADSVFYTEGSNWDDWTDLRTAGPCGEVGCIGVIDGSGTELLTGWVGFGDAIDYAGFTVFSAAELSFSIRADDAATFTVYQLVQSANGSYKLKTLQTTSLTLDKATGDYEAVTKALLLEAGDYYISVQSTNAAQGGSASYTLDLNGAGSTFYTEGNNWDDWTDLKTLGPCGMVGNAGVINEFSTELLDDWVGFGDESDYAGFTIFDDAELSFSLEATDAASFAVYRLVQASNGTFKLKTLQTSALAFDKETQKYSVITKALKLEAGDYYFSVRSTNAGQGGGAYYKLSLNESGSRFFPDENAMEENWGVPEEEPGLEAPDCFVDNANPVEWALICGYPACEEPATVLSAGTPADDVLAAADGFHVADVSSGLAAGDFTGNQSFDALKGLSTIA
jgi:hypothetical protein